MLWVRGYDRLGFMVWGMGRDYIQAEVAGFSLTVHRVKNQFLH